MGKYASRDPEPLVLTDEQITDISSQAVTKPAVEAVLTGVISSHSHSGSSHTQGTDQYLDYGGTSQISAAQTKTAYDHSQATHAPTNAVTLATVKADTDIASAISLKHSNSLDHSHSNSSTLDAIQEALTTALKSSYDGTVSHAGSAHAPSNAQKNSDITGAEIEAKLTGTISSHSHAGGSAPTAWGKYY